MFDDNLFLENFQLLFPHLPVFALEGGVLSYSHNLAGNVGQRFGSLHGQSEIDSGKKEFIIWKKDLIFLNKTFLLKTTLKVRRSHL
jgi:hypothetical protein